MQGKENILDEVRQVSGLVADISRKELYEVPDGYFEGFAGKVLELVRAGLAVQYLPYEEVIEGSVSGVEVPELSLILSDLRQHSLYTVPAGYFEGFADKMLAHVQASEELAGLSSLLSGIGKKTPFSAPEGYFDQPDLSQIMRKTGSMSGSMSIRGADAGASLQEDAEPVSPALAGLRDKEVYRVPVGYFDGLGEVVLARVKQSSGKAKVVSFGLGKKWIKYAAAAMVAGLLVTGGWLGFHRSDGPGVPPDVTVLKNLANVSDQEIQNYLDNDHDAPLADAVANSTATLEITDSDAKNLLGDIPDEELKKYAEENGAFKDVATN